jgi:hypothetical protein
MYRIKDWDAVYESSESRKLKSTRYVCTPNKHDGKGFGRLALHPQKVELFCAWNLILQVASKCPVRGVLEDRDGAITPTDMALKTGFPEAIFTLAYEFFSSGGKLAWLEPLPMRPGESAGASGNPPGVPGDSPDAPRTPDFTPISTPPGDSPGTSRNLGTEEKEERRGENLSKSAPGSAGPLTPKQEFWDLLVELFQLEILTYDDEQTIWQQCQDFRAKGATAAEVRKRVQAYREKWPTVACTPKAILRNWSTLKPAPSRAPERTLL